MEIVLVALAAFLASVPYASSQLALTPLQRRSLQDHNQYRAKHGSPALIYGTLWTLNAVECADHYITIGAIDHSCTYKGEAGENLFMWKAPTSVPMLTNEEYASLAAKQFYDEIKFYNFSQPGWVPQAGHFTQLVWKSSEILGIAMASKKVGNDNVVVVVNLYYPSGNVEPLFVENVLPAA